MESTTKVVLERIFNLSNHTYPIKVIKRMVTSLIFAPPSPDEDSSRNRDRPFSGRKGQRRYLAAKVGFTDHAGLTIRLISEAFPSLLRGSRWQPSASNRHQARNALDHVQSKNGCQGSMVPRTTIRSRNAQHRVQSKNRAISKGCPAGYQSRNFSALCQMIKSRYSGN